MSKFIQTAFNRPVQHIEIAISPKAAKYQNLSLFWFKFGFREMSSFNYFFILGDLEHCILS